MTNVALTYMSQGRWKEAEELDVQVMQTRKWVLVAEHPSTLTSIANLASTYGNQGRWKEAEELEAQVMGGEEEGTWRRASSYADQHGQRCLYLERAR
jgi:hypothetical protein